MREPLQALSQSHGHREDICTGTDVAGGKLPGVVSLLPVLAAATAVPRDQHRKEAVVNVWVVWDGTGVARRVHPCANGGDGGDLLRSYQWQYQR